MSRLRFRLGWLSLRLWLRGISWLRRWFLLSWLRLWLRLRLVDWLMNRLFHVVSIANYVSKLISNRRIRDIWVFSCGKYLSAWPRWNGSIVIHRAAIS